MTKGLNVPQILVRHDTIEFPVHHMRGGTSTGLVLWEDHLPPENELREELLRHLMGVPIAGELRGNRQITGLGRGPATSNKVFLVNVIDPDRAEIRCTLAQLASDHGNIDWSVNCGNMSAAIPLWAYDVGLWTTRSDQQYECYIFNTNTNVHSTARLSADDRGLSLATIPGVDGAFPAVDLFILDPIGAKTGQLLPTGQVVEQIHGYTISCVDVAVPMVIADATQFGKTAHEPIAELQADADFMAKFHEIWVAAGLRMGLRKRDGNLMTESEIRDSETIPKACIVGRPQKGGNISVRYFTPQQPHSSMAVSGACCLSAAALIPGSVAHNVAEGLPKLSQTPAEIVVGVENPAGILEATIDARSTDGHLQISEAAYRRNAQIIARGHVPLYRASSALREALLARLGA